MPRHGRYRTPKNDLPEPWQLELRPGDRVEVLMDQGDVKDFAVKYEPWQLGHGVWVIGLEGRAGGYQLTRVQRKLSPVGKE